MENLLKMKEALKHQIDRINTGNATPADTQWAIEDLIKLQTDLENTISLKEKDLRKESI